MPARVIKFSGYEWTLKESRGRVGPGQNVFGSEGVRIAANGRLRGWSCSKVILNRNLGCGEYHFFVMADPIKPAKKFFDQLLSKADPASMPDYDPHAKDSHAEEVGRKDGIIRTGRLSPDRQKAISQEKCKIQVERKGQKRPPLVLR